MAQMNVRLSSEELEELKIRAAEIGMSLNSYVREVLKNSRIEITVKSRMNGSPVLNADV